MIMAPRTKSFPISVEMLSAIKRWAAAADTSDSDVIRVAVELGLRSLQADPAPLLRREAPDLGPPKGLKAAEPMGDTTLRAGMDSEAGPSADNPESPPQPPRMPPTKPTKRPPPGSPRDRDSRGRSGSKGSD